METNFACFQERDGAEKREIGGQCQISHVFPKVRELSLLYRLSLALCL